MVCLYVDDILIIGNNNNVIKAIKWILTNSFEIKYLGVANVTLGIKNFRTSDGVTLSQTHYIEKALGKFRKYKTKPTRTPVDVNINLSKNNGESMCQQYVYTIIVNLRLEGYKIICIIVSLDIYVVDIISLSSCSQMVLYPLTTWS